MLPKRRRALFKKNESPWAATRHGRRRARAPSNLVLSKLEAMMAAVWARLLVLAAGWAASALIALLAGTLLDIPKLPVLLAGGGIWSCLLLILLQ
jgi:hypothetical protein